jgi:malate dehydrogenase (oxaloacetate-decarboxylating)(NADP+)
MFFVAAKALAHEVSKEDLALGRIYPPLGAIREVSATIATAVAEVAYANGLAQKSRPDDLSEYIHAQMFIPDYPVYDPPQSSNCQHGENKS